MSHRHLDIPPGTATEDLPSAAIVDLLERGDLDDWRPLLEAVARDPVGDFATRVARLIDEYPMYGTSPLFRAWLDRVRARADGPNRRTNHVRLAALRRGLGLRQVDVAARMGMSQSDLSKFERRRDVRLSTLRAYLEALGGEMKIVCEMEPGSFSLRLA